MKKFLLGLVIALVNLTVFAQLNSNIIKISDDIQLVKISENAYIHLSHSNPSNINSLSANGLILIDKKNAFLFDTPWTNSQTEILTNWLNDSLGINITGFVPNHWHSDCIGGLEYLKSRNIKSYANQMTIDKAKLEKLPVPDNGFNDSLELKLGNKKIMCYYLGAAHSLDNIAVWIPSEQILFAGCTIKSIDAKDLGNPKDGDLKAYPLTLEKLIKKFPSAKIVIPGHGKHGGLELLMHTIELAKK